ncbi:MAG TPA: hypothetical protein VM869_18880 [Enhygromyxa sp.]|nr:hypothetical protein [Enhygromyxa sp.]
MSGARAALQKVAPLWQLFVLLGVVALLLLAAFPYFEQIRNANELPRLVQAMSLVDEGEWAIDGASRRELPLGPDIARSPDGRLYPNKPPGASVVGAVAYAIAKQGAEPPTLRELTWWARLLAGVIPVLCIVGVAWGWMRQLYAGPIVSAAILLWVFGTPMFSYARLFYGHALAACLLFGGVVLIERASAERNLGQLALGSLLAAAAITVEYGAAFAGIPIAVLLAWPLFGPHRDRTSRLAAAKQAAVALAVALIPVGLLALYQRAAFGSVLATGYHHAADPSFAALHGQGLLGLGAPRWDNVVTHLLALDTGLLAWSPLVVAAVLGLVRLVRSNAPHARAARLQLSIFAVIVLMGLGLSFEGGWRIGPRYLVVALPMLIVGLAEFMERWRDEPRAVLNAGAIGLLGFAASWSLLANGLAATLWPHLDPTNISEPFGAVLLPLWADGFGPYGLPTLMRGGLVFCVVGPMLLAIGALIWAVGFARPQIVLLPLLVGVGAGVITLLAIVPRSVVAHPKTERNLQYIERVYEPRVLAGERTDGNSRTLKRLD